jgi:hypothetical protein
MQKTRSTFSGSDNDNALAALKLFQGRKRSPRRHQNPGGDNDEARSH